MVATLLLRAMALLGKTECQLESSPWGRDWLEVHCSAIDDSGSGDVICYVDSQLHAPVGPPDHENGRVIAVFGAHKPTKINCCSTTGTVVRSDLCFDFVDEHPIVPPPPSTNYSTSSSTFSPAVTASSSSQAKINLTSIAGSSGTTTTVRSKDESSGGNDAYCCGTLTYILTYFDVCVCVCVCVCACVTLILI